MAHFAVYSEMQVQLKFYLTLEEYAHSSIRLTMNPRSMDSLGDLSKKMTYEKKPWERFNLYEKSAKELRTD